MALVSLLAVWGTDIYRFSRQDMKPVKAHYILVLGAKTQGNVPGKAFQERIDYAIDLFHQGFAPQLFFTGGPGEPPQALVAKQLALAKGVPESAILIETQSTTTFENLKQAKALLSQPREEVLLIVSDPLHLKRAMLMAEELELRAFPAPVPDSVYQSPSSQAKFLLRETLAYAKYRVLRWFR